MFDWPKVARANFGLKMKLPAIKIARKWQSVDAVIYDLVYVIIKCNKYRIFNDGYISKPLRGMTSAKITSDKNLTLQLGQFT